MKNFSSVSEATKSTLIIAMVRNICIIFCLSCSSLALSHSGEDHDGTKKEFVKQIAAGQIQEDCLLVKSGQTLGYTFSSDQALRFNLHYHIKSEGRTVYEQGPALAKVQPPGNGYTSPKNRLMCLMWENKNSSEIRLEYSHWLSSSSE